MAKKQKQEKPEVVTAEKVAALLAGQRDCDFTRLDICRAFGRSKTSHMIRVIEQAVTDGKISRDMWEPVKGRPYFTYTVRKMPF